MILAGTEQLHERISQISARNRELEKALRTLQGTVSDQPHPLLVLRINTQQESPSAPSTSSSNKSSSTSQISPITHPPDPAEVKLDDEQNMIDAFGVWFVFSPCTVPPLNYNRYTCCRSAWRIWLFWQDSSCGSPLPSMSSPRIIKHLTNRVVRPQTKQRGHPNLFPEYPTG